jgi:hypothetical protein
MGLIKQNYVSKETGIPLPTAYAKLRTLVLNSDGTVRAVFAINQTRSATDIYAPLDRVEVSFMWDRKTDLAKMAYEKAKTQKLTKYDEETHKEVEVEGVLFGWENDIV